MTYRSGEISLINPAEKFLKAATYGGTAVHRASTKAIINHLNWTPNLILPQFDLFHKSVQFYPLRKPETIFVRTKGLATNELTSDANYVDVAYNYEKSK